MTNTKSISSLEMKLKDADFEIQQYVIKIEKENVKFKQQLLKLKKLNMTLKHRINVLERNSEKWTYPKHQKGGDIKLNIVSRIHKKSP